MLLAFKANEHQSRDKYSRAADKEGLPADVARVLKRGAADEERHYRWAEKTLERMGAGRRTVVGRVAKVVEVTNAAAVDAVEEAEKPLMVAAEATTRGVKAATRRPLRKAAIAAAVTGVAGAAGAALVYASKRMR